jgi:CheY-like chemotaxis protein/DNA-directed RNA polymerase specialized sigma24 family protein
MSDESSKHGERQTITPGRTSDADLLAALRLQRLQALEILYDRYAGIVMAACLRIVQDRAAAEQVVETVFLDLWEHSQRFTEPLVYRLVSHARTIAIGRREFGGHLVDPGSADTARSVTEYKPAQTPDMRWQYARTQRAMVHVPDDARQIVEMICLGALEVLEVARRLNLTPADVRQKFAGGMHALREALRIAPAAAVRFDPARIPLVSLDRLRVLVVDDEPDARRTLTRALQTVGASVTSAAGVAEAMALLSQTNPEVQLSDLAMPEEDGFDLIRKIRRGGRTVKDLPAVALTAFADRQTRRDAMLAGFQVHVAKPVNPYELAEVVANLTGRSGSSG